MTGERRAGRPRWAEFAAAAVVLAMMSNALLAPLAAPDQNTDAVPWLRLMWLPVYAVIAGLMAMRPSAFGRVALPAALTLVLVAWAFASVAWSIAPEVTLRRAVALLATTAFGLYLAARYDWRGLIELIAGVYLALALGSYAAALGFPDFGRHVDLHAGAWRGLWYEKNMLGGQMAIGALALTCAAAIAPSRRGVWSAGAAAAVALVVLSTSTSALVCLAAVASGMAALAGLRRGGALAVVVAWALVIVAGVFVGVLLLSPELFFSLLGKDETFTGRTAIWEALLRRVEDRPWLGYGFGAFWTDPWGPAWFIRQAVQWQTPNAHNGWLDILAQLGRIGLLLTAAHFLIACAAAARNLRRGGEAYWTCLYIGLFALFTVSESTLLQFNSASWVLYVATMAKLMQSSRTAEAPPRRGLPVRLFPDEAVQAGASASVSVRATSTAP